MGGFIIILVIVAVIMMKFKNKGREIDRSIEAEKRRKAEAIRKANEKNRVEELEERVEELEDMLIGRDDDYDDYD